MASARTITPVNIRLGLDVSKLQDGMKWTSRELSSLSRLTAQGADGATRYAYALDLFAKATEAQAIEASDAAKITERLAVKYGVVTEKAKAAADAAKLQKEAQERLDNEYKQAERIIQGLMTKTEKWKRDSELIISVMQRQGASSQELTNILTALDTSYGILTQEQHNSIQADKQKELAATAAANAEKQAEATVRGLMSSTEKYRAEAMNLVRVLKQKGASVSEINQLLSQLRDKYGIVSQAAKDAKDAEDQLLETRRKGQSVVDSLKTSTAQYNEKSKALFDSFQAGQLGPRQYSILLERLDRQYGIMSPRIQRAIDDETALSKAREQSDRGAELAKVTIERGLGIRMKYHKMQMDISKAYHDGKISLDDYRKSMAQLNKEESQERKSAKGQGILGTLVSPRALATGAAFAGIAAVGQGARSLIDLTMQSESIQAMTEAMTGSEVETQRLMASYRELDRQSLLSMQNFGESGRQLISMGVNTKELVPILDSLSKVSMGNEEKMSSLTRALGQVQQAGRLTGQETLQFVNAGWNPLAAIAKKTGEEMSVLKKRMEEGGISVNEVKLALMEATTGAGQFANINEKMQGTLTGQWAKVKSDFEAIAIQLGRELTPAFQELLPVGVTVFKGILLVLSPIKKMIDGLGASVAFLTGGFAGLNKYLDRKEEIAAEQRLQNEMAKQQKESTSDYMNGLRGQIQVSSQLNEAKNQQMAFDKEIAKMEENASEAIEKKWYKAKYGEEAEIQRLKDKRSLAGQVAKLTAEEQEYVNKKFIRETEQMEKEKERTERQDKLMKQMREELVAAEKLIEAKRKGLVVSEDDLKRQEKLKEFGDGAARSEFERMLNRKIALETEQKQRENIEKEAKKANDKYKKFRDPNMAFGEDLQSLMKAQSMGMVSSETFQNAGMDMAKTFLEALNPNNVSSTTATTLKAGSSEAYKFMQEQNERRAQRAEQKALLERMIRAIENGNDINRNKGVVGTIRN